MTTILKGKKTNMGKHCSNSQCFVRKATVKVKKNSYLKELIGLFSSKYFLKNSAESPLYFQYQVIDSKSKHVNNNHKLIPI
jgi:hypothetical protein